MVVGEDETVLAPSRAKVGATVRESSAVEQIPYAILSISGAGDGIKKSQLMFGEEKPGCEGKDA